MAMVDRAAHAYGVLLQQAKPWRRLTGVGDAQRRVAHGLDEGTCEGRGTRKALHEVQRGPLGREDGGRGPCEGRNPRAGRDPLSILGQQGHHDARIHATKHRRAKPEACQHQRLAGDQMRGCGQVRRDDRLGRHVAPAQVLLKGQIDEATNSVGVEARIEHAGRIACPWRLGNLSPTGGRFAGRR